MNGREASERFSKSVDLHLRLEPRYVVTKNDEIVLHPIAVLDVVGQQGLAAEAHAPEHSEGSALIRGHLRGELFPSGQYLGLSNVARKEQQIVLRQGLRKGQLSDAYLHG